MGGWPGCEPCCQSRTAMGSPRLARDLLALDVEIFATDGTREHLAGDGIEVALGRGPDPGPAARSAARSRPSTTRSTPGSSPAATSPARWPSSRRQGIGPIDLVIVNVKPFAPAIGAKLVGLDEAIEMIDVGGAALLGAAARNSRRGRGGLRSVALRADRRGAARARPGHPGDSGRAGGRGVQHGRRLPRRDRRLPQPDLAATPSRAGSRSSSRRSTTCATARTRTSAPRSTARPPTAAARSRTRPRSPATGRRSTTCWTSTPRTASRATTPARPWPSSSTPTRSASPRTTSWSRPTGTRSRPTRSPRSAASSAVNRELDGATAREIAANSYEAVVAPGLQPGRARDPAGQEPASSCWPSRRPDRGHARLRHREPRLQAHRRRAARRDRWTTSGSTAAGSRSSPSAGRRSRS